MSARAAEVRSIACGALALALAALNAAAIAAPVAHFSRTTLPFSYISPGYPSPLQPVFVTNTGDAPLALSGIVLGGLNPGDFVIAGSTTCTAPGSLAPGQSCRIDAQMMPVSPRDHAVSATITVQSNAAVPSTDITLTGVVDPALNGPILVPAPAYLDFGPQPVGAQSAPLTMTITNRASIPFAIGQYTLLGGDAGDFAMSSNCATGQRLAHDQACTVTVNFTPSAAGPRATELAAQFSFAGVDGFERFSITGTGAGAAQPVTVVEYYNAVLDHYFITWVPAEQANLDAGNTPTKWTRTGYSFRVYTAAQAGTSPVCRYYLPPLYGDSHFFGRGIVECNGTGAAHPAFVLEDPAFMHVFLPTAGVCAPGMVNVYRVFSNRADANHRYMTDRAVRDQMVARGWLAEGDGPDLVVMCAV